MSKKDFGVLAYMIIIFAVSLAFTGGSAFIRRGNTILEQEQQIQELNREIGEYKAMDSFWEEYMGLLDEIYQGKINEAVLQERIFWLERCQEPTVSQQQMYDDFEELIEIIIHYYENTDQVVELETYVEMNHPALYERIMGY